MGVRDFWQTFSTPLPAPGQSGSRRRAVLPRQALIQTGNAVFTMALTSVALGRTLCPPRLTRFAAHRTGQPLVVVAIHEEDAGTEWVTCP